MFSVSRGPGSTLAAFLALTAVIAGASGCSSTDAESRQAATLGTRLCVLNSWTEKVSVVYTKKDTSTREGLLGPNEQSCAEGTDTWGTDVGALNDVGGYIRFPEPARALAFTAGNPFIGLPEAYFAQYPGIDPDKSWPSKRICTSKDGMKVGDTNYWDNGAVRISIKRLRDDQWKEFVLIIEPSQGQRVGNDPCLGGG